VKCYFKNWIKKNCLEQNLVAIWNSAVRLFNYHTS